MGCYLLVRALVEALESELEKVFPFLEEKPRQKLGAGFGMAQVSFCSQDLVIWFEKCHNMCLKAIMRWHNLVRLDMEAPGSLRKSLDLSSASYQLCKLGPVT